MGENSDFRRCTLAAKTPGQLALPGLSGAADDIVGKQGQPFNIDISAVSVCNGRTRRQDVITKH